MLSVNKIKRVIYGTNSDDHMKPQILKIFIDIESELKQYLLRFLVCRQDVEDVLQEAYIRVSAAEEKRTIHTPKSFIYKVVKNLALSEVSKKSRKMFDYIDDLSLPEVVDEKPNLEESYSIQQEIEAFYDSVIKVLPEQCRRVFIMRKAFGFSHKEIARQLDISVSTVEKHLMKGVKRYDEYLKSEKCHLNNDVSDVVDIGLKGQ